MSQAQISLPQALIYVPQVQKQLSQNNGLNRLILGHILSVICLAGYVICHTNNKNLENFYKSAMRGTKMDNRISFRLSDKTLTFRNPDEELLKVLNDHCEETNTKQSTVIRKALYQYFSEGDFSDVGLFRAELIEFRNEFARVGGNLNQISHFFNMHGGVQVAELANAHTALREDFKKITNLLKKALKMLRPVS